jgi:hypothetical protein
MINTEFLTQWHKAVIDKDYDVLDDLLADEVEFHSPTLWKPKEGKDVTKYILMMISQIFEDFEYHREFELKDNFGLEFSAKVDGKGVKGIDLIRLNNEGKIIHFEVMIRPLNTLQLIFEKMTAELQKAGFLPNS